MNSEVINIIMDKLISIDIKLDTILKLQATANESLIQESLKSEDDYSNKN